MERSKKKKSAFFKGQILVGSDLKSETPGRTTHRRARYWCFRFRTEALEGVSATGAPKGFKKFIEGLPGFEGWGHFADTWDIRGKNPFWIVIRIESVWAKWDQVIRRVSVPLDLSPKQRHDRMKALELDYAKRNK